MSQIKHISIVFLLIFFTVPIFVQAQDPLVTPTGAGTSATQPLVHCGGPPPQAPCEAKDISILIQSILNLVFMFAGFIVAAMFMYAGFLLLTSQGNPGQISKAKNIFKRVVMGFVIMFLAYITVKNLLTHIGAEEFISIFK
jgi:hypothetical protein